MNKYIFALGISVFMVCGAANAATGQIVSMAKSACQNNQTQCSKAKTAAKSDAQKEVKAAKDACAKNQTSCDNVKSAAKKTLK